MTTREEVEAACDIVRKYKTMRSKYPLPETLPRFVDHARAVLADAYLIERAERQRRIDAAACEIEQATTQVLLRNGVDIRKHRLVIAQEIAATITRHLDGETT